LLFLDTRKSGISPKRELEVAALIKDRTNLIQSTHL